MSGDPAISVLCFVLLGSPLDPESDFLFVKQLTIVMVFLQS